MSILPSLVVKESNFLLHSFWVRLTIHRKGIQYAVYWFFCNFISLLYTSFSLLKTDRKRMLLLNGCYKTVSGHFFAILMFIFHKAEVQMVILIRSMGLNLIWFKSYGLKGSMRLHTTLTNSQKNKNGKVCILHHNF